MKSKIMRKALAVIMTFMMVMTAMPTVFAANVSDFTDFPTGWSSEAVRAAVDNGLLNGRTPTTLEPTGNLTRAELAAIINRAFGATIEKDISQYTDVSKSQWYYHDIAKAVNMQTFSGDNNNLMRPDDNITREEVFAVVARALVLETSDYSAISAFGDGAYVSDWAKKYVSILASKKYINGNNYGNICPKDYITREEFAQMMHNIIKTYYTKQGTFIYTGADSSLIRTGEVTLSNVTIDGDLIIGDGVGRSNVYLNNVTIKGRLLCRGGEGQVKLTNTTVERGVVVKDVNGTVHFENYRDEAPFANIAEITPASFLSRTQNNISGGGSGSSKKTYVTYYTEHYLEDYDNEGTYVLDYTQKHTKIEKGNSVGPVEGKYTGYVLNKTLGDNPDTMAKAYEGLTFKLYYDIIRYDVKINLPDSSVKDITYKYGQKISDKFDLNAYGDYEFYYTNDKGEEVIVTDTTLAGENMEIKCRALRSVTFDHNDTTGAKTTVKIGDGKKLGTLPTVTRDGYKLIGWNTAADGSGTDYNESSVISADITLYAQWAEIGVDYIVTFHKNDGLGNIFKKVVVRKNNTVDEPTPAPTRTNYNFTGWYTDAECTHKFDFTTPITDNTELYAGWSKVKYSVIFNVDGAPYATADIEVGEKIGDANMPAAPSKAGYEFDGWFDGTTEITKDTVVNGAVNAEAKFTKLHTVIFNADGSEYAKITVRDNEKIGTKMPSDPSKTGYSFDGWFAGTTEITKDTVVTADITASAKFTLIPETKYTVKFIDGTTEVKSVDIVKGKTIGDANMPAAPSKAGYEFDGWFDGATEITKDTVVNANITATAKYTKLHTVTFMADGAEVAKVTVRDNTAIGTKMPADPVKSGYKFEGWFVGETEVFSTTIITADMTVEAKYTLSDKPFITITDGAAKSGEEVTLKVVLSNNTAGFAALRLILDYDKDIMTLEEITDGGVLANPVMNKDGATLTWSSADDMKINGDIATLKFKIAADAATGDYDVKVKIDDCYNAAHAKVDADKKDGKISVTNPITKYTVKFMDGTTEVKSVDVVKGEKIGDANMPTAPSKAGYEFDGWFDGTTEITKDTVVNANITATAKYTKLHTVTFMADGAEVAKVTVRDNTAIGTKMPADPVKSGYTFDGWFSGENEVLSTTIITADMTVEAKYTLSDKPFITITDGAAKSGEEVTLKVVLSNNTAGFAALRLILDYDKDIMTLEEITDGGVLANPVMNKDGATLTWSSADDMKINGDIATLKFKIAADAATGDYDVKVKIDDCYNAAHAKVDADKKDGKISVTNPITKYTVKFIDGTTEVKSVDVVKGEKIGDANMPAAPSKAGYEFDGWFDGATEITKDTVVNANITATAKYTKLHTVTFMADGAEVAKVTVRDNTAIGTKMPADPVKSGYKFEGWFVGETEVFSTTIITADMTVEAKYTLSDKPFITITDGAAKSGEEVTLKVVLSNNTAGFAALRLILDYDKDIMTLEEITDGGVLANPVMNKDGATLTWSSADDMKINGDIATLKFKIAADAATGDYDVKVKIDDCYNAAHTKVDADKKDGKISVTNSERMLITVSDGAAKNGEYVTLKVNLSNNKAGFAALRLILDYDKDIMTLEDITDEGVLENPVMNKGGATLTWSSADDMKLEGDIATLKFKIADGAPAGDYDVKITVDDCYNAAHAKVDADKKDGKISVTASSLFAVRFFDGAVADTAYNLSTKSVSGGSTISDSDLNDIKSGATIDASLDGYTDGAYTHKIYPHFWYKDDSGEWVEFDSSVVINKNTDVFYCYKKIAVSGKLSLDGMTTQMITFSVPYETDTRIADTAKDAMTLGRNQVKLAFAHDDIYLKAIEKAASKSSGVLSNDGTVNMAEAKTKIVKIISASEINDEIKNYVRKTMKSGTDEKLKSVTSLVTLEELSAMSGVTVPDYDTAVAWIKVLRSQDEANGTNNVMTAADALYGAISAKPYYTEFINSFKNEDETFKVNKDNADFVLAVATAVNEYTYAELKTRIHSAFGGIVDLVGDAAAEDFMRDAQDRYYSGANDLWDSIKSGSVTEADYDAFLTFRMNPIEHIFKPVYNQRHQKIIDRLKADGKFYYDENPYLRELVEISADEIVADLFATTSAAGSSGYALYPSTSSESGIMHYYDYALEKMKLADKAAMWYKNEKGLSDSETETLKENIYDEIAKSINETNSSIDAYVADGTLPMNLTVDTLKTITAFASLYDSYESKIDSAINKYKDKKYYGKTWDKESVAADKELSKSVEILLGLDDPTYNADNFMNESEMWNRLEFKPFVYANDDVDETQSVKAYERTLRGNYLSLRSYLSY